MIKQKCNVFTWGYYCMWIRCKTLLLLFNFVFVADCDECKATAKSAVEQPCNQKSNKFSSFLRMKIFRFMICTLRYQDNVIHFSHLLFSCSHLEFFLKLKIIFISSKVMCRKKKIFLNTLTYFIVVSVFAR